MYFFQKGGIVRVSLLFLLRRGAGTRPSIWPFLILPLLIPWPPTARAAEPSYDVDYVQYSSLAFKKGVLGSDYTVARAACIVGTESKVQIDTSKIQVSIVYNAEDYKKALHIDQKAELTYLAVAHGSDDLSLGWERADSKSTYDIITEVNSELPADTIDNIDWDEPTKRRLAAGEGLESIRRNCGDRYVETVYYAARFFAILHVSSEHSSELRKNSLHTQGHVGMSMLQASGELNVDMSVSKDSVAEHLELDIYSEGLGNEASGLTAGVIGIVGSDSLQSIAVKLSALFQHAQFKGKGQPVRYKLAPLPGMTTDELESGRIIEFLGEMKANYDRVTGQLDNAKALRERVDPRAGLLRQPVANQILDRQIAAYTKYRDDLIDAHRACVEANKIKICKDKAALLGPLPEKSIVELPLIHDPALEMRQGPPLVNPFSFFIDGDAVAPGQMEVFLSGVPGTTLLDLAKKLKPDVRSVDVKALILSAYVSSINLQPVRVINNPADHNDPGHVEPLGAGLLLPGDFDEHSASTQRGISRTTLVDVLHADVQNPCQIFRADVVNVFDPACLTPAGRMLRDVTLVQIASYMNFGFGPNSETGPPSGFRPPLHSVVQNCFSAPIVATPPMGVLAYAIEHPGADPFGPTTAKVVLWLPVFGGGGLPLFNQVETHDLAEWKDALQKRLAALEDFHHSNRVVNPCSTQVP